MMLRTTNCWSWWNCLSSWVALLESEERLYSLQESMASAYRTWTLILYSKLNLRLINSNPRALFVETTFWCQKVSWILKYRFAFSWIVDLTCKFWSMGLIAFSNSVRKVRSLWVTTFKAKLRIQTRKWCLMGNSAWLTVNNISKFWRKQKKIK